ncbi:MULTISPECIES: ABC transporter permease [unclassified Nocardioides]|uniref:ABC transporter permease n=1 Tax=unclassified Nocardioides TaxID=2615069 RepID=UPI0036073CCF
MAVDAPVRLSSAPRATPTRRVASRATQPWVLRTASILFVLGLWEWAGRVPVSIAFPTCSETLSAFVSMIRDGTFAEAYAETLGPLLVGVGLAAAGGILAGLLMGLYPRAEWFGLPLFIVLQASPSAAIIPLITFVYGIGFTAKVFAVVLLSAPVIVLNSYRGIANTPANLMEMSSAFMASTHQRIWKIVIPAASGLIFAGLRLGLAQGFTGAILAELIITPTGVGDLITYYRSVADYPRMFAAILSIIIFASVSISLLQRLELRLFRPEMRPQ